MIQQKNRKLTLLAKKQGKKEIRQRHIRSAQIIDFVDLNLIQPQI